MTPNEDTYRRIVNGVSALVENRFPESDITLVDMVRLLCLENDTLRMTLGMPLAKDVLDKSDAA